MKIHFIGFSLAFFGLLTGLPVYADSNCEKQFTYKELLSPRTLGFWATLDLKEQESVLTRFQNFVEIHKLQDSLNQEATLSAFRLMVQGLLTGKLTYGGPDLLPSVFFELSNHPNTFSSVSLELQKLAASVIE